MSTYIPNIGIAFTAARVIQNVNSASDLANNTSSGPWRPPEWSEPATTMIIVPPPQTPAAPATSGQVVSDGSGLSTTLPGAPAYNPPTILVFDAVFRIDHSQKLTRTAHPVQTGSNITDHAYRIPAVVQLEIGMSDAMASYDSSNWTSDASKSVSAYQTILTLLQQRTLVTLNTRLDSYDNMLVESIQAPDTLDTAYALKATITFSEVILPTVTATSSGVVDYSMVESGVTSYGTPGGVADSARPDATNSTNRGVVQAVPVSQSLLDQHMIPSSLYPTVQPLAQSIPGAGLISSNSLAQLVNG